MNISEMLDALRANPKDFSILGKGAHCLALVHHEAPDCVLLLEIGHNNEESEQRNSPHHARAVSFARQCDELLTHSLASYKNHSGIAFLHPELLDSAASGKLGNGIYLHIGQGNIFIGHSARLIRRIPGKALHYLDFIDPHKSLGKNQLDGLANDIASWMYILHHEVSTGMMVRNKVQKQFQDAKKSIFDRPLCSDKYKIFVTQNVAEIKRLSEGLSSRTLFPTYESNIRSNMEDAGVNFELMEQSALLIERQLRKLLPKDRIGLTHSDIHPGNILVNNNLNAVNGICDWMSAGIDALSVDFAGLGLAHGLLPKVVKAYCKREKDNNVAHPVNPETIYAYAAIRNIYITLKGIKNGYGNGCAARVAWEQVGECFDQLSRINSATYGQLARRHKRQRLPPLRMPKERNAFKTHPSFASRPQ